MSDEAGTLEGHDCNTRVLMWTGIRVDHVFGLNSELRALGEVYVRDDPREFLSKLVAVWEEVMKVHQCYLYHRRNLG